MSTTTTNQPLARDALAAEYWAALAYTIRRFHVVVLGDRRRRWPPCDRSQGGS